MSETLNWTELHEGMLEVFNVSYASGGDVWAKAAWEHVVAAGMTDYNVYSELAEVQVRALALAAMYCDHCQLATEEPHDYQLSDWREALDIDPFQIGFLVGKANTDGPQFDFTTDDGLPELIKQERRQMYKVLSAGFGDMNKLYESLWHVFNRYTSLADFDEDEDDPFDSYSESNARCLDWVMKKCPML